MGIRHHTPSEISVHLQRRVSTDYFTAIACIICRGDSTCVGCKRGSEWSQEYIKPSTAVYENTKSQDVIQGKPYEHILERMIGDAESTSNYSTPYIFVVANSGGFLSQGGLVTTRMKGSRDVKRVFEFGDVSHHFGTLDHSRKSNDYVWTEALNATSAVICGLPVPTQMIEGRLKSLDSECKMRLSFEWLQKTKVASKCIALVGIRPNPRFYKPIIDAATSLNIKIIAMDRPGNWIENVPSMRHAFLPIDLTPDDKLDERILKTITDSGIHIDGIYSLLEPYLVATAKAAAVLRLPCEPWHAFAIATNKARTRNITHRDIPFAVVNSNEKEEELIAKAEAIGYPLIVKPISGWNSEGVRRVLKSQDLRRAFGIASQRHGTDLLLEPYVNGPEVDGDFVLHDGCVLFCEVRDDLPSPGDNASAGLAGHFVESGLVTPSSLPPAEVSIIKETIYQTLLEMGFHNGAFHVEARVQNSSCTYTNVNGLHVLQASKPDLNHATRCVVIEVNPRPAGFYLPVATKLVYGIDYFTLALLAAIDDGQRMERLCQPYLYKSGSGAYCWSEILLMPTTAGGEVAEDPCDNLRLRAPELFEHVDCYESLVTKGEIVKDPTKTGVYGFSAYFIVTSEVSHRHVLELADSIRQAYELRLLPVH